MDFIDFFPKTPLTDFLIHISQCEYWFHSSHHSYSRGTSKSGDRRTHTDSTIWASPPLSSLCGDWMVVSSGEGNIGTLRLWRKNCDDSFIFFLLLKRLENDTEIPPVLSVTLLSLTSQSKLSELIMSHPFKFTTECCSHQTFSLSPVRLHKKASPWWEWNQNQWQ